MEFWLIVCKIILLAFLAANYIQSDITKLPWMVFSLLLYLCVNIAIYIVKKDELKKVVILLSIMTIIVAYDYVQPLFILLLPLSLCEVGSNFLQKKWQLFLFVLAPVLLIRENFELMYALVAALCFTVFVMNEIFSIRLTKFESQMDQMRKNIQKLTKNLNENNEYIRQSEYTFKLEERNRLSQEIHDKIGHSMTGALIQMEASKRLMEIDKGKAQELLQNAINISKDGIENIRLTLKNMKPPTEQLGINRIKLFIDEFSAQHNIKTNFLYEGNVEIITAIQWKIIHENLTEALTNSMKYAEATAVSIEIHVLNKLIKLEIKDNGKGAQKITKGLGIVGMEERTASINGTIIVDGLEGFTVTMLFPTHE